MCRNWNPRLRSDCDEPRAESVSDREKANFCDWFALQPEGRTGPHAKEPAASRSELDRLFGKKSTGEPSGPVDNPRKQLDELFGGPQDG
jgi:hypothetical protein